MSNDAAVAAAAVVPPACAALLLQTPPLLLLLLLQVLFNPDYKDTDHAEEAFLVAGGGEHESCGTKYIVHKYCGPIDSSTWWSCNQPGRVSNYHWPQFSLHPGVWRMPHMSALGPIEPGSNFELNHGFKYVAQGLKTAFWPDVHAVHLSIQATLLKERPHIITETYARHGIDMGSERHASAYDLRGTAR
jgi:hypothetical protein